MAIFVANATALANRFICVLTIHHVRLADDKRLGGHSGLHGALDALFLAERPNGALAVTFSLEKLKDEEDGIEMTVHLDCIVIARDGDGDEVSTLVVSQPHRTWRSGYQKQAAEEDVGGPTPTNGYDHTGDQRGGA